MSNFWIPDHSRPFSWQGDELEQHLSPRDERYGRLLHTLQRVDERQIILLRQYNSFRPLYLDIHRQLEQGCGVWLFRLNELTGLTKEEYQQLFFKLCLFIGQPVSVDRFGQKLKSVMDKGQKDSVFQPVRGHLTNQALPFHTDRADLTMLGCWSPAATGGELSVCSSSQLLQRLQTESPAAIRTLMKNIPHDLRDEGAFGKPVTSHPVIVDTDQVFLVRYIRRFINSVKRHGIQLEHSIVEALDALDRLLELDKYHSPLHYTLLLQPGDVLILNNHTTLHARQAFEDSSTCQRYHLRCWLASEYSRALPDAFSDVFHDVAPGSLRGGILHAE